MDEETGTGTGMKRGIGVFFKPLRSASLMAHSPEDEIFNRVTSSEVQLLRPTQAERAFVAEGFTASRKLYELNNPTESQKPLCAQGYDPRPGGAAHRRPLALRVH